MNSYEIGMLQAGHGASLARKTLDKDRVIGIALVHDLGRDRSPQPHVHAAIDGRHATAGNGAIDPVTVLQNVTNFQPSHASQYG